MENNTQQWRIRYVNVSQRAEFIFAEFLFSFGDKAVSGSYFKDLVYNKVVLEGTQYKGVVQNG